MPLIRVSRRDWTGPRVVEAGPVLARELVAMSAEGNVRRCRVCGCTQARGCAVGCWWVALDLCSECKPSTRGEVPS